MRPNLTKARKAKSMTQKALGEMIGRKTQTICDLEKGKHNGSVEVWDKLETILGVDQRKLRQTAEQASYRPAEAAN